MIASWRIFFALATASLMPSALAVIFAKGREQRFENGYIDVTNSGMQVDCLKWHNYFRKLHGVPLLTFSPKLAEYARRRAIQLAVRDGTNFYHPDDLPYGENLAWNSQEPIDCGLPLKLWYDEWKIYNFRRPNVNPKNGHFTQMVWKESAQLGCGQAISKGKNGGTYTVCNYDPPGNWENEELQNVLPAIGGNYYDFSQETKYKTKKLKIYSTSDGHSTNTETFVNGQYTAHHGGFTQKHSTSNYHTTSNSHQASNHVAQPTSSKWANWFSKPTASSTSYNKYSSANSNKYNTWKANKWTTSPKRSVAVTNPFVPTTTTASITKYKPGSSFRMSFGNNKPLW